MSIEFADKQAEIDFSNYCAHGGGGSRTPVHPEHVAEVLWNIPTIFIDEGTFDDDTIAYADFEHKRIVVECCGFEPRERFSTAHEVGHFSLHGYLAALGEVYERHEIFREKQADAYASALLMPQPLLVPLIEKSSGMLATPEYLISLTMQHFHVSEPAARIRLENLSLIPSRQHTNQLIKRYERDIAGERQSWSQERW